MFTSNSSVIRFNVCKSGCVVFVHHLDTVVWFTPSCSANHLLVRFFFAKTILSCDADRSNMNGCQIITTKRGNSSNSLDFKEVYSLYRFTENK